MLVELYHAQSHTSDSSPLTSSSRRKVMSVRRSSAYAMGSEFARPGFASSVRSVR